MQNNPQQLFLQGAAMNEFVLNKNNPEKRFYTSVPNSIFELGLKPREVAVYLTSYYPGNSIPLKLWKIFEKKGLAEKFSYSEDQIIQIIKSKSPQNLPGSNKCCEWCNCTTHALHKHHYPLKKCHGGQFVVNICPNCHYEYHFLADVKYRIKPMCQSVVVL